MSVAREQEARERGAFADSPAEFTWRAWQEVLARVWRNIGRHNMPFLSAALSFYGFLSFIPAISLIIMLYGLFADPATIFKQMIGIIHIIPADAAALINEQLANLIKAANETKGWALMPAFAIALYGASGATGGMISSLNIIYEQEEKRSIIRLTLVSFLLAGAIVFVGLLGAAAASALGLFERVLGGLGTLGAGLAKALTWLVAAALAAGTIAGMYRYAPCRRRAKWRWLSLGSVVATLLWLLGSILFGWYASVAAYDATYGSLGAVVALLMWFFVSSNAVLLGAFIDAEAERQTAQDSTTGPDHPMGQRGAIVADTAASLPT